MTSVSPGAGVSQTRPALPGKNESTMGRREIHNEETEAGSPTGGWGPPLGAHRGMREGTTENTGITARGETANETAELAVDAEWTRGRAHGV
jgi:hypothetical protein